MTARRHWHSDDERSPSRSRTAARRPLPDLDDWLDGMIDDGEEPEPAPPRQREDGRRARRAGGGDMAALFGLLSSLAERVESAEQSARAARAMAEDRRPGRGGGIEAADDAEPEAGLEGAQHELHEADEAARRSLQEAAERVRALSRPRDTAEGGAIAAAMGKIEQRLGEMMERLEERTPAPPPAVVANPRLEETLDTLERRLADMQQRYQAQAAQPASERIEAGLEELRQRFSALQERVEAPANPAPATAQAAPIAEGLQAVESRLEELGRRFEAVRAEPAPDAAAREAWAERVEAQIARLTEQLAAGPPRPDVPSDIPPASAAEASSPDTIEWARDAETDSSDLAVAIREIAERQKVLEEQFEPGAVAERADAIGRRVESSTRAVQAEHMAELQGQLESLHRLIEQAVSGSSLAAIGVELQALAERVDALRRSGTAGPEIGSIEQSLRDIRQALAAAAPREAFETLEQRIVSLSSKLDGSGAVIDEATFARLVAQLEELHRQVSEAMPADAFRALVVEVRQLGEKVDGLASSTDVAAIEALRGDIATLREQLRQAPPPLARAAEPATRTIAVAGGDDPLGELLRRIDALQATVAEAPAANERLVADLRAELGQNRQPDFGTLEAQLAAVVARLDDASGRDEGPQQIDLLEERVSRLGESLGLDAASAVRTALAEHGQAGAGLADILQRNLSELRTMSDSADRRTQDMLSAVHDTLRQVVDRLGAIEPARHPATAEPPSMPRVRSDELPPASPQPRDVKATVAAAREAAARAAALKAEAAVRSPDQPLEPGSGRPGAKDPGDALREQLKVQPRPAAAEDDVRQSFIAAARRAAQAAVSSSKPAERADAAVPAPDGGEAPRPGLLARLAPSVFGRKQVVMTMAAIVIALGALQLLRYRQAGEAMPAPAPAAVQTAAERAPARVAERAAPPPAPAAAAAPPPVAAAPPPEATPEPARSEAGAPAAPQAVAAAAAAAEGPPPVIALPAFPEAISAPRLRAAAQAGDVRALYDIGGRLADGRGVARDQSAAATWFRLAGDRGHAPALYRLANLLEKGQGMPRDLGEALRLYAQAAELGNRKAMHNLAALYASGAEGRADYERAFPLFQRAAELGLSDSQYNLAVLYVNGLGTRQSLGDAYTWFAVSAQNGDAEAVRKRDEIATRLDGQALVTARLAAQSFRPRPIDPAANEEIIAETAWESAQQRGAVPAAAGRANLGIEVGASAPRRPVRTGA